MFVGSVTYSRKDLKQLQKKLIIEPDKITLKHIWGKKFKEKLKGWKMRGRKEVSK